MPCEKIAVRGGFAIVCRPGVCRIEYEVKDKLGFVKGTRTTYLDVPSKTSVLIPSFTDSNGNPHYRQTWGGWVGKFIQGLIYTEEWPSKPGDKLEKTVDGLRIIITKEM